MAPPLAATALDVLRTAELIEAAIPYQRRARVHESTIATQITRNAKRLASVCLIR